MHLKCSTCGDSFEHPHQVGKRPRFCPKHRPQGNRERDAKRARRAGHDDLAEELLGAPLEAPTNGRALLLASALRLAGGDAKRAADLVGLGDLPEAELEELAAEAKSAYPLVVAGDTRAPLELIQGGILMLGARVITGAGKIPGAVLGSSIKSLQGAAESLTGGTRPTYSAIRLIINGPGAKKGSK